MNLCRDVILYFLCIAVISYINVLTASVRKKQIAEKRKRSKEPIHMREPFPAKIPPLDPRPIIIRGLL
jgi:hypothetical protein